METPQHQAKPEYSQPELINLLGQLANQFECHAASRGIYQVEEAGRAMRAAKHEIERMSDGIARCYRMLLSEADTKGALFKSENILRNLMGPTLN